MRSSGLGGSASGGCYDWSGQSSPGESAAVASAIVSISLFGLVGNAVVLASLWRPCWRQRRRRPPRRGRTTSTSIFFSSLAASDSLSMLLCSAYELLTLAGLLRRRRDGGDPPWPSGGAALAEAALLEAMQFSITWDSWTTVAIAFFRYRVVSKPDAAASNCGPSMAKKMVAVVTTLAVVLSLPAFFRFSVVERQCGYNRTEYDLRLSEFAGYTVYKIVYSYAIYIVFSYVVPLGLLVLLSAKLIASLLGSRTTYKLTAVATPGAVVRSRRLRAKVTMVTILVASIEALCLLPSFVQAVVREEAGLGSTTYSTVGRVARMMLVVNSAADCVLFSFISESFRWRLRHGAGAAAAAAAAAASPAGPQAVRSGYYAGSGCARQCSADAAKRAAPRVGVGAA